MTDAAKKIDALHEELVPHYGKADTVAGEIIRAVARIGYRYYNDGDRIGVEYGNGTCNPAARYLAKQAGSRVERVISEIWGIEDDDRYEEILETLYKEIVSYLEQHPELKTTVNNEDMWDFQEDSDCEYDEEDDDYDDEEDEDDD